MKNTILFVSLISFAILFSWQYAMNENKPTAFVVHNPRLENNNQKKEKLSESQPIKIELPISEITEDTSENYLSQAEVLDALKKIKGSEDLNALVLSWKENACPACLNSLKQILANSKLDKELRSNAAFVLAKIGTRESIVALMQSLNKKTTSKSEKEFLQKISSESISAIYEPKGIGALAYVITGQQKGMIVNKLPTTLVSNMNNAIASFSDKNGVAFEISKQYWDTKNESIQKAIIDLNHPQTLAALALDAKETGDMLLQKNVLEKLATNPNSDNLDALMSITQKNSDQDAEISAKLNEWTQSHIQTDREGHLIDYLSNSDFSEKQRELAAELLTNITKNPDLLSPQENSQIQEALNKYRSNQNN